jgi:hypothetical protein
VASSSPEGFSLVRERGAGGTVAAIIDKLAYCFRGGKGESYKWCGVGKDRNAIIVRKWDVESQKGSFWFSLDFHMHDKPSDAGTKIFQQ